MTRRVSVHRVPHPCIHRKEAHGDVVAPISVLVVDDHVLFADIVKERLSFEADLQPVTVAHSLEEATSRLAASHPDIALIDLRLGDDNGLELVGRARQLSPATRMVVLSAVDSPQAMLEAVLQGVRVWLPKSVDTRRLVRAIHAAYRGQAWFPPGALAPLLDALVVSATDTRRDPLDTLTARERQVLICLAEGMNRNTIALQLHVSVNTVRSHVQNIIAKLDVHSALEAVAVHNRISHVQ
jgi:DNA-binding NarL/FixJ family response regulator